MLMVFYYTKYNKPVQQALNAICDDYKQKKK